ncbi:hypothetical protein QRB38_13355 [Mycobacterium avium subsp. hominissuis]|uniref:hypothetical protein n=1 Tax=Mycobacterium avium TaxID=1764 RepID=UPI002666D59C|nr:hypothetical protein [Mycobacterium avium]MDO2394798.1 hypothetical protein [Mycobacterium avium subsp. hominissuis]
MTEPDFTGWSATGPYRTLFRVDRRPVWIDMLRVFPGLGSCGRRQDQLPLWVKGGGLRLEPWMEGTLRAWLRRADGGWLAWVCVPASSTNGVAQLPLQLWVEPEAITTTQPW